MPYLPVSSRGTSSTAMAPALFGLGELRHLTQRAFAGIPDQVVGEYHAERLVADHRLRTQYRMPQTQRFGLSDEYAAHVRRQYVAHQRQEFVFARALKFRFEFVRRIEIVGDRMLVAIGHENQGIRTRVHGLIDGILDQRFVQHRQHFLGHDFGRGQESRAETGNGKNHFA